MPSLPAGNPVIVSSPANGTTARSSVTTHLANHATLKYPCTAPAGQRWGESFAKRRKTSIAARNARRCSHVENTSAKHCAARLATILRMRFISASGFVKRSCHAAMSVRNFAIVAHVRRVRISSQLRFSVAAVPRCSCRPFPVARPTRHVIVPVRWTAPADTLPVTTIATTGTALPAFVPF